MKKKLVRVSVTLYEEEKKETEEYSQFWMSRTNPQTILKTAKMAEKTGINRMAENKVLLEMIRMLPGALAGAFFAKWLLSVL